MIRLLRERGLGNSPTRVLKQLRENHTEEWLHRVIRYTTECVDFLQRPGQLPMAFPEPPEPAVVPSCKWLLSVYSQDILTRLKDIKAKITSIYGNILKMDSTKKVKQSSFLRKIGYLFCYICNIHTCFSVFLNHETRAVRYIVCASPS